MLDPSQTELGGVETRQDAKICAELFRTHRFGDQIAGEKSPIANNDAHGELLRNTGHCVLSSNALGLTPLCLIHPRRNWVAWKPGRMPKFAPSCSAPDYPLRPE
jgi:hypothetical protein